MGRLRLRYLEYINKEVNRFKEEDGNLYARFTERPRKICAGYR